MDEKTSCVLNYFPKKLRDMLFEPADILKSDLQEIRIRLNKPVCFVANGENIMPYERVIVEKPLLDELFMNICEHSVYTYQNDINNGFVTLKGGNRVGVCGSAVNTNGKISCVRDISSLNFRIAREYKGCAESIVSYDRHNILIIGPPSCGKTTLLRDIARIKSGQNQKVCIVDERNEISAGTASDFDLGLMTDCLCGYKKAVGIEIAVRTLSPQVIVFDEIGTDEEYEQIKSCLNCGVDIVTSVHAYSKTSFLKREFCKKIVQSGIFDTFVFLGRTPGEIVEIERKQL